MTSNVSHKRKHLQDTVRAFCKLHPSTRRAEHVNKPPDLRESDAQSHESRENVVSGALGRLRREVPRDLCRRLCRPPGRKILVLGKSTQVHFGLRGSLENRAVAAATLKVSSRPWIFPRKEHHSDQSLGRGHLTGGGLIRAKRVVTTRK